MLEAPPETSRIGTSFRARAVSAPAVTVADGERPADSRGFDAPRNPRLEYPGAHPDVQRSCTKNVGSRPDDGRLSRCSLGAVGTRHPVVNRDAQPRVGVRSARRLQDDRGGHRRKSLLIPVRGEANADDGVRFGHALNSIDLSRRNVRARRCSRPWSLARAGAEMVGRVH
jgi:hypothetical protein